jgi:FlaA1/EpsC-like NDP-sugar epimerase
VDLALRMVRLMGLTVKDNDNPGGDIEIEFTGLRPAEKLYEELLIGSDVSGTDHPRILRADEEKTSPTTLRLLIDELQIALLSLDRKTAREILLRAVSGYGPTNGIDDLVWIEQRTATDGDHSSTIVDFPKTGN